MGKGDKKTRKGKIVKGTFGASRPKKIKNSDAANKNPAKGSKKKK